MTNELKREMKIAVDRWEGKSDGTTIHPTKTKKLTSRFDLAEVNILEVGYTDFWNSLSSDGRISNA